MPDEKKYSAAEVLTGSTGNAKADVTPRGAFMGMATGGAALVCYAFQTDATLTGLIFGFTFNVAYLSTVLFDGVIRPRL